MSTRATEPKWRSCLAVALIFVTLIAAACYLLRPPISNRIVLVNWGPSDQYVDQVEIQFASWKWASSSFSAGGAKGRITVSDFPHDWMHGDIEVIVHIAQPSGRATESRQLRSHGRGGHVLCVELQDDGSVDVGWDWLQVIVESPHVDKPHVKAWAEARLR